MINLEPVTQTKLFGLNKYMSELIELSKNTKIVNCEYLDKERARDLLVF